MQEYILTPSAASLSESMRDIGYSLETAVADLIDNSISAGAANIHVIMEGIGSAEPCLAVIDDGSGMDEVEALEAMRPGSRNPRLVRDANDLGRFGLGLKTASFSQCRLLTVISRRDGNTFAASWNLDLIAERNEWVVQILSSDEIEALPLVDRLGEQGTCVLWRRLDRLLEKRSGANSPELYARLQSVENHLSLIYHRFLSGEIRRNRLAIFVNGHPVEPFDPFCTAHKATQLLQEEIVRIGGEDIRIQPYILPHHSKLGKSQFDFYRSRSDFVSNQGAYIYRSGRLMAWGDWFRLVPKTEATKLARVRIDFPNALDELWTIDIKKSRAHPPPEVRDRMRQIIQRITEQSRRVHTGRGDRLFTKQEHAVWQRFTDRAGITYRINREHPLFAAMADTTEPETVRAVMQILSIVESTVPIEAIYADYSNSPQLFDESPDVSRESLHEQLTVLARLFVTGGKLDRQRLADAVLHVPPFSQYREQARQIIQELV